jgi:hypothetical protein
MRTRTRRRRIRRIKGKRGWRRCRTEQSKKVVKREKKNGYDKMIWGEDKEKEK